MTHVRCCFAADALLPTGWAHNVLLQWDAGGRLTAVQPGAASPPGAALACGPLIPGLPNLHSHAFQRGMAGLTEHRAPGQQGQDSFWSWRELMYRFALRINPEQLEAIAFALYVQMLEAGYTSVCEFHYLHHDCDGTPYADDTELAQVILRAARRAGIGLTLLPVLYQSAGFGAQSPGPAQRRFIHNADSLLRLLERLRPLCIAQGARLGLAPHSLRAVPPAALHEALTGLNAIDSGAPIHIHVAEQQQEVDDCLAWSGQRPVAWLLDHAPVDARWCLVHATHMDAAEYCRAAASGAVVGLCPSTEANLGDGIFDLPRWRTGGGVWGIGSDSHVCVNAAEELMLLEYTQRLVTRRRNVMADAAQPHVATALLLAAVQGGAQASARPVAGLAVGQQADFVVLNAAHPTLADLPTPDDMLSAHIFASQRSSVIAAVWVAGHLQTGSDGQHPGHSLAAAALANARRRLLEGRFKSDVQHPRYQ